MGRTCYGHFLHLNGAQTTSQSLSFTHSHTCSHTGARLLQWLALLGPIGSKLGFSILPEDAEMSGAGIHT